MRLIVAEGVESGSGADREGSVGEERGEGNRATHRICHRRTRRQDIQVRQEIGMGE